MDVSTIDLVSSKEEVEEIEEEEVGVEEEDVGEVDDEEDDEEKEDEIEDSKLENNQSLSNVQGKEEFYRKQYNSTKKRELWGKLIQKSLSSDSLESKYSKQSRQQSTGTETATTTGTTTSTSTSEGSSKLVAYYSMPELRLLSWSSADEMNELQTNLRVNRNKPKLTDLHPITFLKNATLECAGASSGPKVARNDSMDTQTAIEEIEHSIIAIEASMNEDTASASGSGSGSGNGACESSGSGSASGYGSVARMREKLQLHLPPQRMCIAKPITEDPKAAEKTARSLSVEYKPQICSSYRQGLRRFSASPSLLVSRPFVQFVQQNNCHETHPSVGTLLSPNLRSNPI